MQAQFHRLFDYEAVCRNAALVERSRKAAADKRYAVDFAADAEAAALARAALDSLNWPADPKLWADVRLLVSELVTNSVRHSGLEPGARVALDLTLGAGTLRVEVIDPGAGFEPLPRVAGQSQAGGWGLYLVDQIADRWGVVPGDGTHVWFELDAVDAGRENLGRAC